MHIHPGSKQTRHEWTFEELVQEDHIESLQPDANGVSAFAQSIATSEENDTIMWVINFLFRKRTKQKANTSSIVVEKSYIHHIRKD